MEMLNQYDVCVNKYKKLFKFLHIMKDDILRKKWNNSWKSSSIWSTEISEIKNFGPNIIRNSFLKWIFET